MTSDRPVTTAVTTTDGSDGPPPAPNDQPGLVRVGNVGDGPIRRIQHMLHTHPAISPALVLIVTCIVFGQLTDRFLTPFNLSLVVQQVAVVGALAIGQTLIVLTAGIDLSVGAVMLLSQMVAAKLAAEWGVPGIAALLIGIGVGVVAGLINGLLVTQVKLPPFIVTLGTLNVFTAAGLLLTSGQSIQGKDLPSILKWTGNRIDIGEFSVTTGVLLMLAMYCVVGFVLSQTAWGRHVYAIGDDPEASRLAGIQVKRVLLSVYVVAGAIFALTAWVLIGRVGSASPNAGVDANLDSITAVVIGGTSLFGGRGRIAGSLLGALIVGAFRSGLSQARVDALYQTLAVGVLVIAAVAMDQWIRKVGE